MEETEFKSLSKTVGKTLGNLKSKRDFLLEQQDHYAIIRERLIDLKQSQKSHIDDSEEQKGEVFGDIIISANKVFLSLGYEYYIEKTVDEALDFVNEKLDLMGDAIIQFNSKIEEANGTLSNLKLMTEKNGTQAIDLKDQNDTSVTSDTEILPTVEIREELDEEGNIVNSTVVPSASGDERRNLEDLLTDKIGSQVTNNTQNEDMSAKFEKTFEENLKHNTSKSKSIDKTKNENEDRGFNNISTTSQVDTENIYSFTDLVRQMEEHDQLVDGSIDPDDIDYDFDKYKNLNDYSDGEYNEDDDEDYENSDDDEIYGRLPGHSNFMDQLNQLRATRGQLSMEPEKLEETEIKENKPVVTNPTSDKEPEKKSILKKDNKKKAKKSVGFASSLDVHEVESFKAETKNQTFNFPRPNMDLYSMVQDKITDDTNNPNLHEFDSDLFAKLIGAKESDEIHDIYKNEVETTEQNITDEQYAEEQEKKKHRVSRFKKDMASSNHHTAFKEDKVVKEGPTVSNVVVERELVKDKQPIMKVPKKKTSRFAQRRLVESNIPVVSNITENNHTGSQDIVEKKEPKKKSKFAQRKQETIIPLVSDIVENNNEVTSENIVEKEQPKKLSKFAQRNQNHSSPVVSNIMENNTKKPNKSAFKNNLSSLNIPKHSHNTNAISQELLDLLSDDDIEDEEENAERDEKVKVIKEVPKIEEIESMEYKKPNDNVIFPKEIKDAIEKVGKNEDSLRVANVDYSGLMDDMDDMVKAYSLGMYDDDLEEHPGTLVEKIEDFDGYNKQVDDLKDDIIDFKKNNPMVPINGTSNGGGTNSATTGEPGNDSVVNDDEDDGPIMVDIVEKSLPDDYCGIEEEYDDDLGLHPSNLSEVVNKEYQQLKQVMLRNMQKMTIGDKSVTILPLSERREEEIEPLDENGNPIRVSRFKTQRMNLDPNMPHIH